MFKSISVLGIEMVNVTTYLDVENTKHDSYTILCNAIMTFNAF